MRMPACGSRRQFCQGTTAEAEPSDTRAKILDSALKHVETLGWSTEALAKGCTENNLSVGSVGMFPNGAGDLVNHFMTSCNKEIDMKLSELGARTSPEERFSSSSQERTTEKLAAALQLRLEMTLPYLQAWPQAMAIGALPPQCIDTIAANAELMDIIWRHVGDTSTGPEWYSKRAALGLVYTAAELHLLTDSSPGHQATWDFLGGRLTELALAKRQLNDVGSNAEIAKGLFESTVAAAKVAAEKGVPAAGAKK